MKPERRMSEYGIKTHRRRTEQKYRDMGRCTKCGEPTGPGIPRCKACLEKHKLKERARREYRKANRLCPQCGLPLTKMDEGFIYHNKNHCTRSRRRS